MFFLQRLLKLSYVLGLGAAVFVLSRPAPVRAQRTFAYIFLPGAMTNTMGMMMVASNPMSSYMNAMNMLSQAGVPAGMSVAGGQGMGGGGMMGMRGGMMGMGGGGMMMGMGGGMMGMSGGMMMGMMGMGMRGGMMGMGMRGGMMGMGMRGGMMGMGGMGMRGMGMRGGMMGMGGFAGKGFGGFNGKKAL